jgi:hypothetical protein
MKNTMHVLLVSAIIFVLGGCAPVQFYSNKALTEKSGLKYYTVKPFLHVERDPETGRIVKATVIWQIPNI